MVSLHPSLHSSPAHTFSCSLPPTFSLLFPSLLLFRPDGRDTRLQPLSIRRVPAFLLADPCPPRCSRKADRRATRGSLVPRDVAAHVGSSLSSSRGEWLQSRHAAGTPRPSSSPIAAAPFFYQAASTHSLYVYYVPLWRAASCFLYAASDAAVLLAGMFADAKVAARSAASAGAKLYLHSIVLLTLSRVSHSSRALRLSHQRSNYINTHISYFPCYHIYNISLPFFTTQLILSARS